MRYAKLIPLLLLLLPAGGSRAQDVRPGFRTIGVNDGLSQNSVNSIFQDSRGYMWLGTGDGLNRYDGAGIKSYKVIDSTHAGGNSNTIRGNICEDKKGNIWFSTETGVYCLDRQRQVVVHGAVWNTKPGLNRYAWYDLKNIDGQGNLYLVSYVNGIVQVNTETHTVQHWDILTPAAVSFDHAFSAVDKKGNIWFRAEKKGVFLFDLATKQFSRHLADKEIVSLTFGKHKSYIAVAGAIYLADSLLRIYDSIAVPATAADITRSVYEDGYEQPWLLSYSKGMLRYDAATKKMTPPADAKLAALCANTVCLFNDRNNNMWIGTDGNGVCRIGLKPGKFGGFPQYKEDQALVSKYFTKCICEDSSGIIWFGTFGNGFFRLNGKTNELIGSAVAGSVVGAIVEDDLHNIWVGGNNGLYVYHRGECRKVNLGVTPPGSTDQFVSALLPIDRGKMLVATALGLFLVTHEDEIEKVAKIKVKFPRFGDLVLAKDGTIWGNIRTLGAQRLVIAGDSLQLPETVYPQSGTSCIHADEQDNTMLWIGADKGLVKYDIRTKKMRIYNEADGLGNSHVYAIIEDGSHKLWLSTNGGIYSFDKQTAVFKNYTVKDGLQSNEFNTDCCYKSRSGTLYFGGINGFNWFTPSVPAQDTVAPLLDVASISIDDTLAGANYWTEDSVITMPHGKKTIRFSFAVLDYTQPEANSIMYTLGDGRWYKANDRVIQFASLAPGNYTLSVKAVNSAGGESAEKKIRFSILPPFWQTPWFALGVAVTAIVIIVLVTRSITQRKLKARLAELEKIKEIDKERLRISREMHDDIGAGLTQITLMTEMAKNKPIAADSKELQDIALTSRRLVSNMNEIIWSLNAEGRTLEHLFAYLRENLNKLLEYSGIEYSILFAEPVPDITLSNEQRRNLLLIVKEAANNAVKYSKASNICISATLTATTLSFTVADDGVGFNMALHPAGNGLNNLQKRTADLAGELEITSAERQGTTVAVTIPLKSHFVTGK